MCGIAGIFRLNEIVQDDIILVQRMTGMLSHRGPDAEGLFQHERCTLGHRRLSIIDLDARSNQPFTDVTGRYTLVFNGQIYNFREIKAELHDYPFRTLSDTEVIVAAYARWGAQCLERMNGMFAFAIYDASARTLFIARDRLGVKPLYYAFAHDVFLFASEVRALLSTSLVPRTLDMQGVQQLLMYQSAACPHTIIAGIRQLHPGHYATVRDNTLEETRYWTIASGNGEVASNYKEACAEVRKRFLESVERRMVSDVPLGAFLSGGIDSSAVVAAMSQVCTHVETFSIIFREPDYDESAFSNLIAQKYATRHHMLMLTPEDFLAELPNALDAMDNPSADGMNTYVVSKMTRQAGITVALSGLGGDELFAGYPNFKVWKRLHSSGFFTLPLGVRQWLASVVHHRLKGISSTRLLAIAKSDGLMSKAYPVFREVMPLDEADAFVNDHIAPHTDKICREENLRMDQLPPISQYSMAELTRYTRDVLLKDTDQFSMASALEVREPFFDHLLVDYVLRLPDKWKIGSTPKRLFSDAMGELLPDSIVHRQKRGFTFPWRYWLKHDLRDIVTTQISYLADHPAFCGDAVRRAHTDFMSGTPGSTWKYIWQMVALSHWIQKHS